MHLSYTRQTIVPVPTGSNPLWLEKKESRQRFVRFLSLVGILILFATAYVVLKDYNSAKDPNASECKMGFSKTGCLEGYKCIGDRVDCTETGEMFKYRLTGLIFPEKKCNAPKIYKEFCVKDETNALN